MKKSNGLSNMLTKAGLTFQKLTRILVYSTRIYIRQKFKGHFVTIACHGSAALSVRIMDIVL